MDDRNAETKTMNLKESLKPPEKVKEKSAYSYGCKQSKRNSVTHVIWVSVRAGVRQCRQVLTAAGEQDRCVGNYDKIGALVLPEMEKQIYETGTK